MKFIIMKDNIGEWRWQILARNGRIVADGGEGYKTKAGARGAIKRLIKAIHSIPMEIEVDVQS